VVHGITICGGIRYVQAMENAASGASAAFGGNGYQQLKVDIAD
jgi:hypothetical protein